MVEKTDEFTKPVDEVQSLRELLQGYFIATTPKDKEIYICNACHAVVDPNKKVKFCWRCSADISSEVLTDQTEAVTDEN